MRASTVKSENICDAAFGTIFRISDCFQRSKHKLYFYFSHFLTRQVQNLKTISAIIERIL
jgi:hypothetical protein